MISNDQALEPRVRLIRGESFELAAYRVRRHQGTPNWLLIFTVSGEGELAGMRCLPGSIAIVPPRIPQEYGTAEGSRHWEILWVHVVLDAPFQLRLSRLVPAKSAKVLPIQHPESIQQEFRRLVDLPESENSELRAMNIIENLVLDLSESVDSSEQTSNQKIISRVQEHIHLNLGEALTIEDLGRVVNRSPSRLRTIFSEEGFASPRETVEKIRMEKAATFLRFTSMKVSTISHRLGFSSPFYFSLRFKKEFGISPSEYREKA